MARMQSAAAKAPAVWDDEVVTLAAVLEQLDPWASCVEHLRTCEGGRR